MGGTWEFLEKTGAVKLKAGAYDYVPRFLILHGYAGFINILDLHLHMDQIFPMWTLVSMFCGVTDFSPLGAVPRSVCIGAAAKISESFGGIIIHFVTTYQAVASQSYYSVSKISTDLQVQELARHGGVTKHKTESIMTIRSSCPWPEET